MISDKPKSLKSGVYSLLKEGLSYEEINEKIGIPLRIITIWHRQNIEYKVERLEILYRLLKYCSSSCKPVFSSGERILLNQERAILLRDEVLLKRYEYPKELKSKIEFTLSKIKSN